MSRIKLMAAFSIVLLHCQPVLADNALWQALYDGGLSAQAKSNISEAEKQFAAALKNADSDEKIIETAGKLALIYDQEGKFPQAEEQYQHLLDLDKKLHGATSTEVGADLNSLALALQHGGKFVEAETSFRAAIKIFEKGNRNLELAAALTNLALLMQETAKYDAVEPLFKRSLDLYEKSNQKLALAGVLDRYATFCQNQGRYSEADALFTRCLSLRQTEAGQSSPLVAETLSKLGQLHTAQGEYSKGEEELRRAYTMVKEAGLNINDTATAPADCLRKQGRYADARPLYEGALDALQSQSGTNNAKVGEALRSLAQNAVDLGDYVKAENMLVKALTVDRKAYGDLHPGLAIDLQTLGLVYLDQGKYDDAQPLYQKALKLTETVLGPDHPSTATSLNNLAWLYYNMGLFDQAEPLILRALAIRRKQFGPNHPLVAHNLSILAKIQSVEGKYDDAEKSILDAIAAEEESLGVDHPDISENLKDLAVIYSVTGRNQEAEETLRKLLPRDEKNYGANSACVASDLEALSAVLRAEDQKGEAAQLTDRAQKIKTTLPGARTSSKPQSEMLAPMQVATKLPSGESVCVLGRPVKDKWAVVVGISNFREPTINLQYAAKDATDFRNYLIKDAHFAPDHIKLLIDGQATRENIVGTLGDKWLRRLANSDDIVCLYISSHGSAAKPQAGATNFVVPYEGNLENIVFTGIPMQWLTAGLKDLVHCDRMIVILDVCHGGAVFEGKGLERTKENNVDPQSLSIGEGEVLVVSSTADQTSWESCNYQNGVFTKRLIEGLRLKGDQTKFDDAFNYMKSRVEDEVLRDRAAVQTPMMEKKWQGEDPVIGIKPVSPRPGLETAMPANARQAPTEKKH